MAVIDLSNIKDVEIRKECAGIGDIVYVNGDPSTSSYTSCKIIKGDTYSTASPFGSSYSKFGVIYGFEGECAMIMATTETNKAWASTGAAGVPIPGSSENISTHPHITKDFICDTWGYLRNGEANAAYHGMNVDRITDLAQSNNKNPTSTTANARVHPTTGYWNQDHGPMSPQKFKANINDVLSYYNTYYDYIKQTFPIGNGDGSVFDSKYHIGKQATKEMQTALGGYTFPAAEYCYNYQPVSGYTVGFWWLPDMIELRQMMKDSTYRILEKTAAAGGMTKPNTEFDRWSSVRRLASSSWFFSHYGVSFASYFYHGLAARPVCLLKLK